MFLNFSLQTNCSIAIPVADETLPVGKLRAAADAAFSKGDMDQSLKLWQQVSAFCIPYLAYVFHVASLYLQVLDAEPENPSNYYKRFRVHLRQKNLNGAVSDLSSAIARNPDYEQAYAQRGKLNLRLGNCFDAEKDFLNLKRCSLIQYICGAHSNDRSFCRRAG